MSKSVKRGPQGLFLLAKRSLAPVVWMPLLSFATLGIVLLLSNHSVSANHPQMQAPSPAQVTTKQPTSVKPAPNPQPKLQPSAPSIAPAPAPTAQPMATTLQPYCRIASFGTPSSIDPTSAAPGVTEVTNSPVYYTFHGGTTKAATSVQLANCARQQPALGGNYHGLTSRTISYAYDIASIDDTSCQVVNVRITLHQSILLPQADMSGMPAAAAAQWQATASRLKAHEYEHVAINRQHANTLYHQLTKLSGSCVTLGKQASTTITRLITAMNTANNTLDAHTNHGRQ